MSELIDYAGLFPPAKLSLDTAFQNYAFFRESDRRWMLSRFVVPAVRLAELSAQSGDLFPQATDPFRFSILGQGGMHTDAFLKTLKADLQMVSAFRRRHTTGMVADVLEVVLPRPALFDHDELWYLLRVTDEQIATVGGLRAFIEIPAGASWSGMIATFTDILFEFNLAYGTDYGLKLRCGGVNASDVPSSADVATALLSCRDIGVALKATAGLHHPLRHFDPGTKSMMHGFLNVFGAGILAHVHRLDSATTQAILDDEKFGN